MRKLINLRIFIFSIVISNFNGQKVLAQTKITLETSVETALKNNSNLKSERLKSDYQKQMIKSAYTIAPISISGEYGQINSFYNDTKFGISQTINFPAVYTNQKKMLNEEWKTSVLDVSLKEAELKKAVMNSFYSLIYLNEKQNLLKRSDSIFAEFLKKSALRFKKGESNILEKTTAETQRGTIKMQLLQLQEEKEMAQLQFQLLLNDEQIFIPTANSIELKFSQAIDSTSLNEHPNLKILAQTKKVAEVNTKLEKAKLLPNITFGYNNNSFVGNGPDNVLYDKTNRFHSAQIVLGIPLFGGTQKAKINASKTLIAMSENDLQNQKKILNNRYKSLYFQHQSNLEKLSYFENSALPNAKIIEETANKQFYNGDINYLEWTMLINQSIAIKNNFIETVLTNNQTIIELNYLLSK
jgi:cobalt-zinc-cadmium resistance protein CzcA